MSRGKRYNRESKLNIKKVIAVLIAILVIIMFVVLFYKLLSTATNTKTIGAVSYYSVYTNGKWGVIDSKGNIVIEPTMDDMITIPNHKIGLFICTYNVDMVNKTYQTKVVNEKQKELFTNYDLVEAIENYDTDNILWYEEGVLKVKKDDSYGLIDITGKEILKPEYDDIVALQGLENSLLLAKGDKLGLADNQGRIIIKPEYDQIKGIGQDYKNGYIVVNNEGTYGVIDFNGQVILNTQYEDIKQVAGNGLYVVVKDGKNQLINKEGTVLIDGGFDEITAINAEQVIFVKNKKYGVMNTKAEQIIAPDYEKLTYAFEDYYIAKKSGKYGVVSKGEVKLPCIYTNIIHRKNVDFLELEKDNEPITTIVNNQLEQIVEGIVSEVNVDKGYLRIRVRDEYKYYNLKFEEKTPQEVLVNNTLFLDKKDGKYGYVDKDGKIIIEYIYEDGLEQNQYGYMAVKKDGKWGALDKTGKQVADFKYELENNVIIDFIGKWHLGEDINSNYYTDHN